MLLRDMITRVLVQNGQHLVDPTAIEISPEKFKYLVLDVLARVSKYDPIVKKFAITTNKTNVDFTDSSDPLGIPLWISKVVPITSYNTLSLSHFSRPPYYYTKDPVDKVSFPVEYRKPTLYLPYEGTFDVVACYRHIIEGTTPNDYTVVSIDDYSDTFFKLLSAAFLKSLAMSRRAFTLDPVEISTDANDMISDAKTMEEEGMKDLIENDSDFTLSWG